MAKDFDKTGDAIKAAEAAVIKALTSAAVLVHGAATLLAPVDTGNLRSSLAFEVGPEEARVGTNVEYAPYLEYGTSRMAAQPSLRPALDNNRNRITKLMGDIIGKAVKGAGK